MTYVYSLQSVDCKLSDDRRVPPLADVVSGVSVVLCKSSRSSFSHYYYYLNPYTNTQTPV